MKYYYNLLKKLPQCPLCHGSGFRTRWRGYRENTDACELCYTTGLKNRWLIWLELRRLAWLEGYVPQFYNDQFSPMLYPPMPWTCRGCNGVGVTYDGYEACEDCQGDGLRWHFMRPVLERWYQFREWRRKRREAKRGNWAGEDEIPF